MEKRVNGTWLFLVLAIILIAVVFILMYTNRTADSYSGGILVELPARAVEQCAAYFGET